MARRRRDANLPASIDRVQGDVTVPEDAAEAVADAEAVVNLVAMSPLKRPTGGEEMHDRVHRAGTETLVEAAEDAEVDRFLQMSGIHADPAAPTAYLRAKGRAEEIVRKSDLEHVIVRPTVVFGDGDEIVPFVKTVAPPYLTPLPGGGRTQFQLLWIGDLAPMLADAVVEEAHANETYELGGPDILPLSRVANLIHRADGRPSTTIPVPMALAGIGMRLGQYVPGFPFGPDQYRSLKMDLVTERNDLDAFGVEAAALRTFRDYLGVP
jgi:NADH dehydrogenase